MDHQIDLFIATGEMSGDLHGAKLIEELLLQRPGLKIGAVAGPNMRKLNITEFFRMENLSVMGFIDVFLALPKIIQQFFAIRNKILELRPKAVVFIDYPGFHLRLEKSLRKKGYKGKLIHFICPTVWAWGKKRANNMAQNLDLLLAIFPFEKECFVKTKLPVHYVGHPLTLGVSQFVPKGKFQGKILGIFPGSRKSEIERNLPLQLKVAKRLQKLDPTLKIAVSIARPGLIPEISDVELVDPEDHYELMRASTVAIATSGTVTLELALHGIPTVVNYAIKPFDCFLAQRIFRINLPFYCIVNIILNKSVFPEFFGPNFNEENLFKATQNILLNEALKTQILAGCSELREALGTQRAAREAAHQILSLDF